MTDSNSPGHWDSLASDLGAEIKPPSETPPPSTPVPPPRAREPKQHVRKPKPQASWENIAGDLGLEVPPPPPVEAKTARPERSAPSEPVAAETGAAEVRPERPKSEPGERRGQRRDQGRRERDDRSRGRGRDGGRGRNRDRDRQRPAEEPIAFDDDLRREPLELDVEFSEPADADNEARPAQASERERGDEERGGRRRRRRRGGRGRRPDSGRGDRPLVERRSDVPGGIEDEFDDDRDDFAEAEPGTIISEFTEFMAEVVSDVFDIGPADDEFDADEPRQEESAEGDERRPRRRRRRGGRGRREGARDESRAPEKSGYSDDSHSPDLDDADAIDLYGDSHEGDDEHDDDDAVHTAHRGIPSWKDTIDVLVSANMAARAKNPRGNSGPPRGRGGRGGRGRGRSNN